MRFTETQRMLHATSVSLLASSQSSHSHADGDCRNSANRLFANSLLKAAEVHSGPPGNRSITPDPRVKFAPCTYWRAEDILSLTLGYHFKAKEGAAMYNESRMEYELDKLARMSPGSKPEPSSSMGPLDGLIALVLLFVGAIVFQLVKQGISWAWPRFVSGIISFRLQVSIGFVVLIVGALFFWFRQARPTFYGVIEIGFGIMLGVSAAFPESLNNAATNPDQYLQIAFGLIGAVYLVVRGLDNATRASREERAALKRLNEYQQMVEAQFRSYKLTPASRESGASARQP